MYKLPPPKFNTTTNGDIYTLEDKYVINFSNFFNFDIVIPKDFETDLASIPPILRWIIDRASLGLIPPLLHDYVCFKKGKIVSVDGTEYILSWFQCHLLFLIAMNIAGIHWFRATIAFLAVLIGVKNWEQHDKLKRK